MSSRINKNHYRNNCSKWRKSKLGKTNPNNRYFMREIKKTYDDFMERWGSYIKANDPQHYYSLINKPLPKKYKKLNYPITPVNAYVPEQSKLSHEELQKRLNEEVALKKQKEETERKKKEAIRLEKERIKRNQEALAREKNYIFWCDPHEPINKNRLGSSQIIKKKNYDYYY